VLEKDEEEVEELIRRKKGSGKGGVGEAKGSEEVEKEKRLRMALEEAKRRNGDA
jgi:hypothetical protein